MFGLANSLGVSVPRSLAARVRAIFKKPGIEAHLYLPGVSPSQGFIPGNYIDSAGTQPAVYDQPVGLVLDAAGSVGAEISAGNDFTGWSGGSGWSFSGGKAIATAATGNASRLATVQAGKTYRVIVRCDSFTSGGFKLLYEGGQTLVGDKAGVGTFEANLYSNATGSLYIWVNSALTATFDYISVREVTGIHASQQTVGYKPIERRGIVNLLTYSNDLTNVIWNTAAVGKTVNRITPDATNALHRVFHGSTTVTSGVPYTSAILAKADGYRYLYVNGAASGGKGQVCFDLQTGTVAATTDGVGTIVAIGDGSYLCCVSSTSASASNVLYLQVNNSANAYDTTFAGDGTSGIYCYASGLFQGTLTAAQILAAGGIPMTTTVPASSSAGNAYLEFDGVDDRLSIGGPLFQMGDDWCVVAAARLKQAGATSTIFSQSNVGNHQVPYLHFNSAGLLVGALYDGVGAISMASSVAYVDTPVVVAMHKVGGSVTLRVNGVQVASGNAAGLISTTLTTVTIGGFNGGLLLHKGNIYDLIPTKGTLTLADVQLLEKQAAAAAGIQL